MRIKRTSNSYLMLLACVLFAAGACLAFDVRAFERDVSTKARADEKEMLEPSDFIEDFPEIRLGMSLQETKKAIEKTGARPVGLKNTETELAWDATFNGMRGRGAVHFEKGAGLKQITAGLYAFEKQQELYEAWLKKLTARHGTPQDEDTSVAHEKLWRLKNGVAILLRSLKDAESPVVEIRWVKV